MHQGLPQQRLESANKKYFNSTTQDRLSPQSRPESAADQASRKDASVVDDQHIAVTESIRQLGKG